MRARRTAEIKDDGAMPSPGRDSPSRIVGTANAAMQMMTLHGNFAGNGALSEVEILASSNPALNQAAVAQATGLVSGRGRNSRFLGNPKKIRNFDAPFLPLTRYTNRRR